MLDTHTSNSAGAVRFEAWDGENAAYCLLGLVDLLEATGDPMVRRLCEQSAAYLYSWVYTYDLENGYNGVTRGGTTCRMPDYPLLYLGAGNIALPAMMKLSALTGDGFHRFMAEEMIVCASKYLWDVPGKPWNGGVVHALDQNTGEHWGPEKKGQVDSGMTSGTTMAVFEKWLQGNFKFSS
jgi:hypothetical protein